MNCSIQPAAGLDHVLTHVGYTMTFHISLVQSIQFALTLYLIGSSYLLSFVVRDIIGPFSTVDFA